MDKIDWLLISSSLFLLNVFFQQFIKKNNTLSASSGLIPFFALIGTQNISLYNTSFTVFKLALGLTFILFIVDRLFQKKLTSPYFSLLNTLIALAVIFMFSSHIRMPLLIINVTLILSATFSIVFRLYDYNESHSKQHKEIMEISFIGYIGALAVGIGNSGFYLYIGLLIWIIYQMAEIALHVNHFNQTHANILARLNDLEERFERTVEFEAKKRTAVMADKVEYIREKSQKDPLSKAYNRNGITNEINGLINDTSVKIFSICMFDIDFFKTINDTRGHAIGDECIKFLAYAFMSNNRKTDMLGRFGGDEFILVMPHVNAPAAMEICDRLRLEVVQKSNPKFTISMGIATYPYDGRTFSELLEAADKGLYHAKETGKNKVSYTGKVPILKK